MARHVYEFRRPNWKEKLIRFFAGGRPVMLNVDMYGGCVRFKPGVVPYVDNVRFHGNPPVKPEDFEDAGFLASPGIRGNAVATDDC